jgi:hypothetical protein
MRRYLLYTLKTGTPSIPSRSRRASPGIPYTPPYDVSRNKSKGLGDRIAQFTKATGIDKAVKSVVEDCGCEQRRAKLNALFPGRNVEMTEQDVKAYEELLPAIERGRLNRHQSRDMYAIFNRTFNAMEKPCNCTGKNKRMVEKLQQAYDYTCKP